MSEIIDRMAVAIFVSADDEYNAWPSPDHPECKKMARMALQSLLDPTQSMIDAASATDGMKEVDELIRFVSAATPGRRLKWSERGEEPPLVQAWRAMVQDALKEDEEDA